MHQSRRTALPASPHPRGAAVEAGRPRPISDPITSTTKKLHRRSRSTAGSPPNAGAVSNPFTFGILKRTTLPAFTPFKEEPASLDTPELKAERRSFGATFSFLQPWNGRNRLGSRSSTSSTQSEASTSGSEGAGVVESGSESESVPAVPKEKQEQRQTSTTHHRAGLYLPIVRLGPPLDDPTTPADVAPPSPPTLAQPGYNKAQAKKVLKHARAELMKEVTKAGYNFLVVEG